MSSPPWQTSPFVGWPPPASSAPPAPLTVDAGDAQTVEPGVPFALAGSASGGVPPYTFLWSLLSAPVGGVAAFVDATDPSTSVTLSGADGTFVLKLTATDAVGTHAGAVVDELVGPQVLWSDGAVNQPVSWNGQPVRW